MQLAYSMYRDELMLGNIADTSLRQTDSFLAQGVVGIARAVIRGTNPQRQCVQAGTGAGQGALLIGIAELTMTVEQSTSGVVQYADKDSVPVMRKGRIVVQTNAAVTAGNVANYVLATGAWTDASVGAGIEASPQLKARFVTSTTAAGLAVLEIHNTN